MRAEGVLEPGLGRPLGRDTRGEAVRIHHLQVRRPDQVDAGLGQRGKILAQVARIAREVLVRRELRGIDEDRHHDALGAPARQPHQRNMAVMQGAHGWNQGDGGAAAAQVADGAAQGGNAGRQHAAVWAWDRMSGGAG